MNSYVFNESTNETFFDYLKKVINYKTLFWEDSFIIAALDYLYVEFSPLMNLGWSVYFDSAKNLIAHSPLISTNKSYVYLCAHIDTVGADDKEWLTDPFNSVETETHIIGRGANDCKAGVAFILTFAKLIRSNLITCPHLGFIITYREEGNGKKTSSQLMFNKLPMSQRFNYFICLENTVKIEAENNFFHLAGYKREPHNLFITIHGSIAKLNDSLRVLIPLDWKPVVIRPLIDLNECVLLNSLSNNFSGHISTLENINNILLNTLTNVEFQNNIIVFGNPKETSVVASKMDIYIGPQTEHELILNYRGFNDIAQVVESLKTILYEETFGFHFGLGASLLNENDINHIRSLFGKIPSPVSVDFEDNPGRSDASSIFNNLPMKFRSNTKCFALGPGSRTHTFNNVKRSTHGPNEGFYKPSSKFILPIIFDFVLNIEKE